MNRDVKKYIYIIGTVCVVFFIIAMIFRVLPWLLLGGFIAYIITKVVKFIKGNNKKQDSGKFDTSESSGYNYSIHENDEYTNGEVIDVEYEDVDDEKK